MSLSELLNSMFASFVIVDTQTEWTIQCVFTVSKDIGKPTKPHTYTVWKACRNQKERTSWPPQSMIDSWHPSLAQTATAAQISCLPWLCQVLKITFPISSPFTFFPFSLLQHSFCLELGSGRNVVFGAEHMGLSIHSDLP